MNLSELDLNLLLVLHAVLAQESVVAAANELHVTPSAVSNALARLRVLLDDPLFVRRGRGLVPTPRALELKPVLASALSSLQRVVGQPERFDPRTSTRELSIAMADNDQLASLPSIAHAFERQLPHARLVVLSVDALISGGGLASGVADLAIAPRLDEADLHWLPLYEEEPVACVRRDHPRVPDKRRVVSKELFNELRHVDTHLALGRPGVGHRATVDVFSELGLQRDIAVVVPSFFAAGMAAASTDLIACLPRRVAESLCAVLPLRMLGLPGSGPKLQMGLVWHQRTHLDEGVRVFREVVVSALGKRKK